MRIVASVVMDIERHLNNRPLTYVESELGEEQVLTPYLLLWGQDAHIVEDRDLEGDETTKLHARLSEKRQHGDKGGKENTFMVSWRAIASRGGLETT